jgi:hypothetical protein
MVWSERYIFYDAVVYLVNGRLNDDKTNKPTMAGQELKSAADFSSN